jgi:hypothetical protein
MVCCIGCRAVLPWPDRDGVSCGPNHCSMWASLFFLFTGDWPKRQLTTVVVSESLPPSSLWLALPAVARPSHRHDPCVIAALVVALISPIILTAHCPSQSHDRCASVLDAATAYTSKRGCPSRSTRTCCATPAAGQQGPRHPRLASLSRAQEHPAHSAVHRTVTDAVQGFLEELKAKGRSAIAKALKIGRASVCRALEG